MSPKVWYIPSKRTEPGKNVGIYCRVSSGEKNQLYSLSAQISALTKAVANVDQWKLTDVFIDIRLSDCCHLRVFERLRLSLCCQIEL